MSNCKNCGTLLKGKYCYTCGEKQITETDRKFSVILKEFLSSFTFYDNKVFRTLRLLTFNPGKLTLEYLEGKRKPYLKPIQLFLLLNLVYFLFPTWDVFFTKLDSHLHFFFYSDWANDLVNNRINELGITYKEYAKLFNDKEFSFANILIIINIFIFSLFVWLVNSTSKRYYYSDHFIYATHFFSFLIFILMLTIPWLTYLMAYLSKGVLEIKIHENFYSILSLILLSSYLIISYKKVYKQKWLWAVIKGPALFLGFVITTIMLYRFILFLVTYWLI